MQSLELSDTASDAVERTVGLLQDRPFAVLTGAGVSTDSGIPAYRGAGAPPRSTPMTIRTYLSDEAARRRYWLGGHLGYRAFTAPDPNGGHRALAALERAGAATGVVTQNVDGLHLRAGSRRVIELHGTMHRTLCLHCGQVYDRRAIAERIEQLNPWVLVPENIVLNPDGDVSPESTAGFVIPTCEICGGMLKPDVVYFGEFVPTARFALAESLVHASAALVVAGTSLTVNSGIRVIERARRRDMPIVIVNHEPTRADAWADEVIEGGTTEVLTALAARLGAL
ncbi:Sir2 family NAD-dependent protein deacetylase [Microbacterium sp. NPDC077391]|uniref:protein acetyllysine N-acetyltransferase n=1 Tax=Microbacterium commune TaxID=2762219 RepID=A0ABR8W721_9MICO|nr:MULTISPECIES: Sir2 family NAD-dependent protein deacetylase [Microbacterium]MBD8012611.1 NAD-dependent deacetylase [Microbacterium commune]OIU85952.1 NAD-dependent deacetylase [Microbacterium sp. AR7-10]